MESLFEYAAMNWYALAVKPQHEKSVAEQLAVKSL
jgi:hypothetical protein